MIPALTESVRVDLRNGATNTCRARAPAAAPPPRFEPWAPNIVRNTHNISVAIGPTGGDRGYSAITSKAGGGVDTQFKILVEIFKAVRWHPVFYI